MSTQEAREALGLTQADAARRAGVSLATWRRWEEDATTVSAQSAEKCERILARTRSRSEFELERQAEEFRDRIVSVWSDRELTPRQAVAIISTLDWWADMDIETWLRGETDEALFETPPFAYLDYRVMMLVGENKAWAAAAQDRCRELALEIERGILPFQRPGCYFDEVLMAVALQRAPELLVDEEELFVEYPATSRCVEEDEEDEMEPLIVTDEDWDLVSDAFDDLCEWDDWEVPAMSGHPLLGRILETRHPFRWFDPTGPRPTMYDLATEGMSDDEITAMMRSIGERLSGGNDFRAES